MHEVGPVAAAARDLIERAGDGAVTAVTVRIGPGVNREVAATAWQVAVAGSVAEGAEVDWRFAHHLLRCLHCGADYSGDELALCPLCDGTGLVISEAPLVTVTEPSLD